jgi:hypothetical protein
MAFSALACGTGGDCGRFASLQKKAYDFRPANLTDAEQTARSAVIDTFWTTVHTERATMLPCLRSALAASTDSGLFAFDGAALLLTMDSSDAAKALQVRSVSRASFSDVQLTPWIGTLALRAYEGFDVSTAGARYLHLADSAAQFYVVPHAWWANQLAGAMFLFGSMPESLATPGLMRIVREPSGHARELALYLVTMQATIAARDSVRAVDLAGFSEPAKEGVKQFLSSPPRFEKRPGKPKTTRAQFVGAFQAVVRGDYSPFYDLKDSVRDGERDVVTVMTAADIPLLRETRRHLIAGVNQHVIGDYESFTGILWTMVLPAK